MDFGLTDEQEQLQKEVKRFADNEIRPNAVEYDVEEKFPHDIVDEAAEMGLVGMSIPIDYGGAGYDPISNILVGEELFAADPGIGLSIMACSFGTENIIEFGTEDQKERFLPDVASGDAISGAAISEPDTGSDVSSISTRAEKDGDEYVINGNKMWITNGTVGDFFTVLCKTDPEAEGRYNGFSQIVVEA
ncbi:acyl-CoA dehydrogenase, partial [Haloglomus irregulare]